MKFQLLWRRLCLVVAEAAAREPFWALRACTDMLKTAFCYYKSFTLTFPLPLLFPTVGLPLGLFMTESPEVSDQQLRF